MQKKTTVQAQGYMSTKLQNDVRIKTVTFQNMLQCNGDDLILNPLFNFEPMKRLEHWEDVRMFGSASNSTCKFILNMLTALNLSDG